jgi:hypothetical protein
MENTEENCEKIWKMWKKGKLIWKISVLVIITPKETQRDLLLLLPPSLPPSSSSSSLIVFQN